MPFLDIDNDRIVSVIECGNIVEIRYLAHQNRRQNIIKLDNDHYMKVRDLYWDDDTERFLCDEIHEFEHGTDKRDNIAYLSRVCCQFRDMINCNVTDNRNALFLTLTYRQRDNSPEPVPMTDTNRLRYDLNRFVKVLRYHFPNVRYLTACEPQCSGSWHAHVLLCFDEKAPFIPNSDISKWWGQGFTRTQKIESSVDNVGAYLTAYLTDIESPDELGTEKETIIDGQKVKKKFVKGGRLCFYPMYFHPFRWSRNCKKPLCRTMKYHWAKLQVFGLKQTFSKTLSLADGDYHNEIQYEFYNRKILDSAFCESDFVVNE